MRALLQKDREWLIGFAVAGIIATTSALSAHGFARLWVLPNNHLDAIYVVLWIAAGALGLFAAVRDEVTRTDEYLWHRPVSKGRIFLVKVFGCGLVIASWLVVPVGLQWGAEWLFGLDVAAGDPSRVLHLWAVGLVTFSAFGVGLLAGSLPSPWWSRLIVCGALGLVVLALGVLLSGALERSGGSVAVYAAFHVLVAALAIAAAYRCAVPWNDADRPWARTSRLWGGSAAAFGIALALTWGIAAAQDEWHRSYWGRSPQVQPMKSGAFRLVASRRDESGESETVFVDANHEATGVVDRRDYMERGSLEGTAYGLQTRTHTWFGLSDPSYLFGDGWDVGRNLDWRYVIELDRQSGLVYEFHRGDYRTGAPARSRLLGKGAERAPFAPGTRSLQSLNAETRTVWLGDPEEHQVYRYEVDESAFFEAVALPDGDRFVRRVVLRRPEDGDPYGGNPIAVVGERGVYEVRDGELRAAPEWMRDGVDALGRYTLTVSEPDVFAPRIEVRDRSGAVVFTHDYAPRASAERSYAGLVLAASALRPPLLQLLSTVAAGPGTVAYATQPALDPGVAGGRRLWLILVCMAIGLACAAWTRRVLAARGADASVVRFWSVPVIALGLPGMIVALFIESRRAHRRMPTVAPESAPPLLIASA